MSQHNGGSGPWLPSPWTADKPLKGWKSLDGQMGPDQWMNWERESERETERKGRIYIHTYSCLKGDLSFNLPSYKLFLKIYFFLICWFLYGTYMFLFSLAKAWTVNKDGRHDWSPKVKPKCLDHHLVAVRGLNDDQLEKRRSSDPHFGSTQ